MRECVKLEGFLLFFLFIKVQKEETDEGFCCLLMCEDGRAHLFSFIYKRGDRLIMTNFLLSYCTTFEMGSLK